MTTDATIGLKLPTGGDSPGVPESKSAAEWGVHAEKLGYDSLWIGEGWGVDALVALASVATRTDEIRLCTGIVNTYSRTPSALSMAGATLQRLSGGRAVLGVGASHPPTVEGLHGMPYDRPVRRTYEAIELIKALTGGGGDVSFDGEIFEVDGYPAFEESVPVYNAALGAANLRATGRVADGWVPYLVPVSALDDAFETIATAARDVGRDPEAFEVAPQILCAVSDDPEEAKAHVRNYVAKYVGGLPNYRNAVAGRFAEATQAIGEAWEADGPEAARARVPDELLFEVGVAGTPDDVREQFRDVLERDVVDCPVVFVPRTVPDDERDETIEVLRPENL